MSKHIKLLNDISHEIIAVFVVCVQHVKTIGNYFHSGGVQPCTVRGCKLYKQLMEILEINSMTSDNLMLKYYKSLTDNKVTNRSSIRTLK